MQLTTQIYCRISLSLSLLSERLVERSVLAVRTHGIVREEEEEEKGGEKKARLLWKEI